MMICPRIVVGIFTASVAALSTASAQDITSIPGACEFVVNDVSQQCDSVVYMHVPQTNRTSFNVPTDIGAIAFSGGEDLQPSRNQYILNLDSILAGQNGESRRYSAQGRCEVRMSEDGEFVHSLTCSADSDFGALELKVEGTDEPVQRLNANGDEIEERGDIEGRCLIEVSGTTFVDGRCWIRMFEDGSGSFATGGLDGSHSLYFAYVYVGEDGAAEGSWNEEPGANHAHTPLGVFG